MSDAEVPHSDPTNADAARAWNGAEGDYWAENDLRFDRGIARFHALLLDAAELAPDARVLDIGCGTGQATRDAARRTPMGSALGIDLSRPMLDVARRRAVEEGTTNIRFEAADAQIHRFAASTFHVAISRAGVMFFGDPVAAFRNVGRALRPGGRMALLVWQTREQNTWVVEFAEALAAGRPVPVPPPDGPGPFSLADPDRTQAILADAGFRDIAFAGVETPMFFGDDSDDAYEFVSGMGFSQFMLRDLDSAARVQALEALRASIEAHATESGVHYAAAGWIITARNAPN